MKGGGARIPPALENITGIEKVWYKGWWKVDEGWYGLMIIHNITSLGDL